MSALPPKKKTILRVKRKYSDIGASDIIVLSQPTKAKRQRTIPWNELTESFNKTSLTTEPTHNKKAPVVIPNFFDFDCEKPKQTDKKHVFRLIGNDSFTRSFQQTNFSQNPSKQLKLKILEQRRTNRRDYFTKMKQQHAHTTATKRIIHHEDETDAQSTFVSTKNGAKQMERQRVIKLNKFRNKLLEKQKASRQTKIATQTEMNALRAKNRDKTCVDWKDTNMISLRNRDGEWINIRNVMEYECFNGYVPKYIDCGRNKGVNITEMKSDSDIKGNIERMEDRYEANEDEYDYYELDEEADVDEVIAAIQARSKWKKEHKASNNQPQIHNEMSGNDGNTELDLECKLEKIKNRHLMKHFDAKYEAPTFGYQHRSKESEESRFGEMTRDEFVQDDIEEWNSNRMQTYYENLINDEEEIEKEDEGYACNQYPDEHEVSDCDDYCLEDDYYPKYNDNYDNTLDIDFFKQYDFN